MPKILTMLVPAVDIHPSARRVFPRLKTVNKEFVIGTVDQRVLPGTDLSNRILIRWGSYYETNPIKNSIDYNSTQSIRWATNKILSRQMLADAGIRVPRVVTPESSNIKYPLIARPKFHSIGKDFVVIKDSEEFLPHYTEHAPKKWYYSEFVDKTQEFRVHVGHGKILCVLEKSGSKETLSWNRAQTGLSAVLVEPKQWNVEVIKASIKAARAIQMDFAGVDVLVDKDGKVYVIELNTTPLMESDMHILEQYAQYFDWLADSDYRRPHFDIKSDDPMDYAWKETTRKTLTMLIPSLKIHPSVELVYPLLKSKNKEIIVATKDQKVLPHINLNNRILIRWGSTFNTAKIPGTITYNTRIATKRANNKLFARKFLAEAGIRVPRLITPESKNIRFPLIARPRFHSLGENFVVLGKQEQFMAHYTIHAPKHWYYSEYIDKKREFRINIAHGKILSMLEIPEGDDPFSWNRTQTEVTPTLLKPNQWDMAVIQESMKAFNILRLDFAGVDVILDKQDHPYVLELNIKPGMSTTLYTQEQYACYFDWLGAVNTRRPHFKIQSDNPEDYVWREDDWI